MPNEADDRLDGDAETASDRGETPHEVADWSALADEHVMRVELRESLVKAVRELPAIYRAPVILRDIQGLSTEEASAVLQVKDQTLKSRLHRGRVILRQRLAAFAGGLSLHNATAGLTQTREKQPAVGPGFDGPSRWPA